MAAPWQGLPVRLERAPHRGAAFALSNASKRARPRPIGSRSRGSLFIFRSSPAVAPPGLSLPTRFFPKPTLGEGGAGRDYFFTPFFYIISCVVSCLRDVLFEIGLIG